jgi:hypothetical protein
MKLINEKGKFFGIINVFDLAVILLLVLVVAFGGYRFYQNRAAEASVEKTDIFVTIKCPMVTDTVINAVKSGDRFLTGVNYVNGTVTEVTSEKAYDTVERADGTYAWSEHPVLKDMYVTVKMHEDPANPILKLGTQEIRVGKAIFMKTQRIEVLGTVYDIQIPQGE